MIQDVLKLIELYGLLAWNYVVLAFWKAAPYWHSLFMLGLLIMQFRFLLQARAARKEALATLGRAIEQRGIVFRNLLIQRTALKYMRMGDFENAERTLDELTENVDKI